MSTTNAYQTLDRLGLTTQPFTPTTAREAGVRPQALARLVASGLLRRPVHGVYVAPDLPDTVELRARCLSLVTPRDCVVVDRHAGWLLGAQMVLAPGEHLELRPLSVFRPSDHGRLRCSLVRSGERNLVAGDVIEVEGIRVTTPLRTAWDLGRVRWVDEAITGLDAMLRLGAFSRDELVGGVERFRGMRWVRTLRVAAPRADGRAESPPESIIRERCRENGMDDVEPQVELWDGDRFVARFDVASRRLRAAVEYDGVEWHSSPEQRARDTARRADAVRLGWSVLVLTADDVFGQNRTCDEQIQSFVRRARLRAGLNGWS